MKTTIFTRAWQIAKEAAKEIGTAKQYFAEALKIAWKEFNDAFISSLFSAPEMLHKGRYNVNFHK